MAFYWAFLYTRDIICLALYSRKCSTLFYSLDNSVGTISDILVAQIDLLLVTCFYFSRNSLKRDFIRYSKMPT